MDAETRKTLDDMASDPGVWHETRAVVQAALREIDALRALVARRTEDQLAAIVAAEETRAALNDGLRDLRATWDAMHPTGGGVVEGTLLPFDRLAADVTALRAQVTELQDAFNLCDGERLFLTEQVADLEARAIPPEWTARFPVYEINAWGSDDDEKARVNVVGAASPVLVRWLNGVAYEEAFNNVSAARAAANANANDANAAYARGHRESLARAADLVRARIPVDAIAAALGDES